MIVRLPRFEVTVHMAPRIEPLPGGYTLSGKPYARHWLGYSRTDCAGLQACAYANRKYIGIDMEHAGRTDLAVRRERLGQWLNRHDLIKVDFLHGWVAREACAKCLGLGLLRTLPHLSIGWTRCSPDGQLLELGLCFRQRWHFITQCRQWGEWVMGVCYRAEYGEPQFNGYWPPFGPG